VTDAIRSPRSRSGTTSVIPHLLRACFTLLVLGITSASAQPPDAKSDPRILGMRPYYTAFPDLKPPALDRDAPVMLPVLPPLPAGAPPLRKVLHEQAREGLLYLAHVSEVIRIGSWDSRFFHETVLLTSEVYTVAAETEEKFADRVPWHEERVRKLKELERFTEVRALNGNDPPQRLNAARFHRLTAEADLLPLKDEVARASGMPRPLKWATPEELLREKRAPFTAFPDLKPPTFEPKERTKPDGTVDITSEEKDAVPLPHLPILWDGAPVLCKLRREQVLEGLIYLHTAREKIRNGSADRNTLLFYPGAVADAYQTAAGLEERAADRVPWYEVRVRAWKEAERSNETRITSGTKPPQDTHRLRFRRLGTEADLLRLKAEADKAGPTTGPVLKREAFAYKGTRPHFTAFPDLKPRTTETVEVKGDDGMTRLVTRDKDVVPLPPLPAATDARLLRKVRLEQVREGLAYLDRLHGVIRIGAYNAAFLGEYGHMATEVYRVAVELEDVPAKRVPWYAARVRTLKEIERFVETRVQNISEPPQNLNTARVWRLRAETELLTLKATAEAPAPVIVVVHVPCPPVYCPPACARPRGGLLPRLFHRRSRPRPELSPRPRSLSGFFTYPWGE
jgi:hypothetical protein